jgi:hypothetical protein
MLAHRLDAILIIALFVAASGLAITRLFITLDRPYLFSFTGSKGRLFALRAVVWVTAALSSVGVCGLLLMGLPDFPALVIFFAFEAIMLDICSQRIEFVRAVEPLAARSAAPASRRSATGLL